MSGELSGNIYHNWFLWVSEYFSHKPHLSAICLSHDNCRVSYDCSMSGQAVQPHVGKHTWALYFCPATHNPEPLRGYPLSDEKGGNVIRRLINSRNNTGHVACPKVFSGFRSSVIGTETTVPGMPGKLWHWTPVERPPHLRSVYLWP